MHLYAPAGCLFNNPVRSALTGMEDTCTAVISLFFVFGRAEYLIYKFSSTFSVSRCPSSVVVAITGIDLFVIEVFGLHMAVIGDVFGEILIGSLVFANEAVIAVADDYFGRSSL